MITITETSWNSIFFGVQRDIFFYKISKISLNVVFFPSSVIIMYLIIITYNHFLFESTNSLYFIVKWQIQCYFQRTAICMLFKSQFCGKYYFWKQPTTFLKPTFWNIVFECVQFLFIWRVFWSVAQQQNHS